MRFKSTRLTPGDPSNFHAKDCPPTVNLILSPPVTSTRSVAGARMISLLADSSATGLPITLVDGSHPFEGCAQAAHKMHEKM
jgi:hypothetical protein